MSNRLFQGVIHQMKDAIDRVIGVIDENGVVIACSELVKIGEIRQRIRDEVIYASDMVAHDGYTYRPINTGNKTEYIVFVEGEDKMSERTPETSAPPAAPKSPPLPRAGTVPAARWATPASSAPNVVRRSLLPMAGPVPAAR